MMEKGLVLLVDNRNEGRGSLLFEAPRHVVRAYTPREVWAGFARLQEAAGQGLWASGYLSYELGLLFEKRLAGLCPACSPVPLMWFGLYEKPERLTAAQVAAMMESLARGRSGRAVGLQHMMDFPAYDSAFRKVKDHIAAGECYQVNLTFRAQFELEGDPAGLYRDLMRKQPVAYGAFINTGDHYILSCSPELFMSRQGKCLQTRPMKGTAPRGRTQAEDEAARRRLAEDEKTVAENLMIVDLLRNDMGKIAQIGSVTVTDLFSVETYRGLHQMTSGIRATLKPGISPFDVITNLFPCGSVTGAPKIRAMEIIDEVELGPRGVYTGAIGFIAPDGDFCFNVAIRTALINARDRRGEIGIGGAIVSDSKLRAEYDEAILKMGFFTASAEPLALIETVLWKREGGFVRLERHMQRLAASAVRFGIALPPEQAREALERVAADFAGDRVRVRVLLHEIDGISVTATPLAANSSPTSLRFVLWPQPTDSRDVFLYHKTTRRGFYDTARETAKISHGVNEVVFRNERDELTEGSTTSLFVRRDGIMMTPPIACGLLPGTLRGELLASGAARERVLHVDDLARADAIYLGNSVHGLRPAGWVKESS
ncbi:MAG: aminodeoxychorismate synthase component I [Hyphomicrobiales bacterium]